MTAATISVRFNGRFSRRSAGLLGFLHPNYSERKLSETSGAGFNGRCPSCQPTNRIKALKTVKALTSENHSVASYFLIRDWTPEAQVVCCLFTGSSTPVAALISEKLIDSRSQHMFGGHTRVNSDL